jgi:GNAT superfamily N-acetyltransferase
VRINCVLTLLPGIQAYLRAAAARGRETVRIGPFLATFDLGSPLRHLSYAIPADGAVPDPAEVAALVEAYTRRERVPRLEYLPELAPRVEPALLAAGFAVELRPPVMVGHPAAIVVPAVPAGVELLIPANDAELAALIRVQHEAFGGDGAVSDADLARVRGSREAGGLAVLARDTATGQPVGAGAATPVLGGVAELVGLAVRGPYRRRGIAAALTGELSRLADRAGATTAFLTPEGEVAERVYARVGYQGAGEMLHISLPRDSATGPAG